LTWHTIICKLYLSVADMVVASPHQLGGVLCPRKGGCLWLHMKSYFLYV